MDKSMIILFVAIAVAAGFAGFISALLASESMEEAIGKRQSPLVCVFFIIVNAIMGAIFKIAVPAVYAVPLVLLAALHLLNREGRFRRASWNVLVFTYAALLAGSVFYHQGENVFRWTMLLWLIPIVLPILTGIVQTIRLSHEDEVTKKPCDAIELRGHIISWAIIVVLIVTFIVLALI